VNRDCIKYTYRVSLRLASLSKRKGSYMTRFSKAILDMYLAPDVSNFRHAEILDLSDETSLWLSKYFLNNVP